MKIEEIIQPGEIILYNSKSSVTDQKKYKFIFFLLMIISATSFYFVFVMENIESYRRIIVCLLTFLFFVYGLGGFILNVYKASNNTAEYWITNLRVIVIQRNTNVIMNDVANLSSINVLKNKGTRGSILLMFQIDDNFINNFLSSIMNVKDNNKLIRFNSVEDPMKAVRILKNINEDVQIVNDDINFDLEDEEGAK